MVLPFEDESFDIVINEAMLTMLPVQANESSRGIFPSAETRWFSINS